jgi:hypothetical protein
MLSATTPATFFGSLTDDLVSDGFLGRLIVVESTQPRRETRFVSPTPCPPRVIEWLKTVNAPSQRQGDMAGVSMAEVPAHTVEVTFDDSCMESLRDFERELTGHKDRLEAENLDVLVGRTFEKSLRLAMICAKARDVNSNRVTVEDVAWSIGYIRYHDLELIRSVRRKRIRNQCDEDTQRAIQYIRGSRAAAKETKQANYASVLAAGAMPHALLLKRMHMKSRDFGDLIGTAIEAGLVTRCPGASWGYTGDVYFSVED